MYNASQVKQGWVSCKKWKKMRLIFVLSVISGEYLGASSLLACCFI
jgi:hypothetical protein